MNPVAVVMKDAKHARNFRNLFLCVEGVAGMS